MKTQKKVSMKLIGLDGNAFSILGEFNAQARRQGWSTEEINAVIKEATNGDYYHLMSTINDNVQEPEWDDEFEDDDDDSFEL